jgi:hypothetical protein
MSVVSFKVSKEIKKKMEKFKYKVKWAEELRKFVDERTRMLEASENIEKVVKDLEKIPIEVPKGFSAALVREDRDSS